MLAGDWARSEYQQNGNMFVRFRALLGTPAYIDNRRPLRYCIQVTGEYACGAIMAD